MGGIGIGGIGIGIGGIAILVVKGVDCRIFKIFCTLCLIEQCVYVKHNKSCFYKCSCIYIFDLSLRCTD